MNTDRKRRAPEQQSAIAKLRKARETSIQAPTREESYIRVSRQETQPVLTGNGSVQSKSKRGIKQASNRSHLPNPPETSDINPYTALPYKQSWDGNRTYERVTESRLALELAEGTGCVVLGRCTVWVKHGAVSILGATLEAGPSLYDLSAPNIVALPTIEAKAGAAEIEIGPAFNAAQVHQPSLELYQPPEEFRNPENDLPFHILGLNFQSNPVQPKQLPILTLGDAHFRPLHAKPRVPGILLCGPRSSGIATLARCFLNRAVTSSADRRPVIFVDLDPILPVLTLPGTIAVSTVLSPVLGPQLPWIEKKGVDTACMHYVGPVETDLQPSSWYQTCLADVTIKVEELRKQYPNASLVVLAAESFKLPGPLYAEEFFARMRITSITAIEGNGPPSIDQAIQAMTEKYGIPTQVVPSINENPHTGRQHNLSLQAYLGRGQVHAAASIDDLRLTYGGPNAQLMAVALPGGNMLVRGLEQALPDLIAAIVVIEQRAVEMVQHSVHRCATSGLPVLPSLGSLGLEAGYTNCLGLSLISTVDVETGIVNARTILQHPSISARMSTGARLMLLVQPPTRDGKFAISSKKTS